MLGPFEIVAGPYPAAAGIRRRVARDVRTDAGAPQSQPTRMSKLYCLFSALLALLSIVMRHSRIIDPEPRFYGVVRDRDVPLSVVDSHSNPFVTVVDSHFNPAVSSSFIDPSLLRPTPTTPIDIIDKILVSTPRILAMINFGLSMTFLLHKIIADWFLGVHQNSAAGPNLGQRWAGCLRLVGYLGFNFLLISPPIVALDTLDSLILLAWYTLMSFARSLVHLCAAATAHASQNGLPPTKGVLPLLSVMLLLVLLAASVCVALFHGAGWRMVTLLTCDCVVIALDAISHMLRHVAQAIDEEHARSAQELEELILRRKQERDLATQRRDSDSEDTDGEHRSRDAEEEPQRLVCRMEVTETAYARRLQILDTTVFSLQLLTYILTCAHFLHIWSFHGFQFTLIDGVLALLVHSVLASLWTKIAERRNLK